MLKVGVPLSLMLTFALSEAATPRLTKNELADVKDAFAGIDEDGEVCEEDACRESTEWK